MTYGLSNIVIKGDRRRVPQHYCHKKNRLRNIVIRVTEGPVTLLSKEHIGPATQGSGEEMEPLQPCDQKNRWAPQHWKTVAMNDR